MPLVGDSIPRNPYRPIRGEPIAAELGLSEVTVKVHRASAMRKMCATSLAHLIKMLEHFDTATPQARSLARISVTGSWPVKRTKSA